MLHSTMTFGIELAACSTCIAHSPIWKRVTLLSSLAPVQDGYRLVCESGCATLDKFQTCNLGQAPTRTMVARKGWDTDVSGWWPV